jgi:hypothetical protein
MEAVCRNTKWTRFCETIFWGKDFAKPRLIFSAGILDFARAEEGSGEECAGAPFGFLAGGQLEKYLIK